MIEEPLKTKPHRGRSSGGDTALRTSAVVVACIVLAVACSSKEGSVAAAKAETGQAQVDEKARVEAILKAEAEAKEVVHKVGDVVPDRDLEWTVISAVDRDSVLPETDERNEAKTAGRFIQVHFRFTNKGKNPTWSQNAPPLVDSQGRTFKQGGDGEDHLPGETLRNAKLPPGMPTEFWAMYEVPSDATGLRLQVRRKLLIDLGSLEEKPPAAQAKPAQSAGKASPMCSNIERWRLGRRYGLQCSNALQDGCDESLGLMVASVERALTTDPARLRSEGATMGGLLKIFEGQIASTVVKPADAALKAIKAHTPTDKEQAVHGALVADYAEFLDLSKRWQRAAGNYKGSRPFEALKKDAERLGMRALVNEVDYWALCSEKTEKQGAAVDPNTVVENWLAAQNEGAFDRYASLYAPGFVGIKRAGDRETEFDRDGWLGDRRRMFRRPMTVKATNRVIDARDSGTLVRFTQLWASGSFADRGTKEILVRDGLIVREEMLDSEIASR